MCRPFTKYRAVIFTVVLVIAIGLLLAMPKFFLNPGTKFMSELLAYESINEALTAIFFNFEIYANLGWQQ